MATLALHALNGTLNQEGALANAAGGGDQFANDGRTFLYVKNGDSGSHTVTLAAQKASVRHEGFGDLAIANKTCVVPAGTTRLFGPFPCAAYNNASGNCLLTYDAVTSLQVAAVNMPFLG